MTKFRTLFRITLIFWTLISLADVAQAARKLYVVVAADTADPKLEKYTQVDAANVLGAFSMNVPQNLLQTEILEPDQITEAGIAAALSKLPLRAEDALVFYYSGHGAYLADGKHYFNNVKQQSLFSRDSLIASLKGRNAGLTVLLADTCYDFVRDLPPPKAAPAAAAPAMMNLAPLFRRLFFEVDGFIDINGCKKGEQAGTFDLGLMHASIFTSALTGVLNSQSNSSTLGWNEFLNHVAQQTRDEFQKYYADGVEVETPDGVARQSTQTVSKISFRITPTKTNPPPSNSQSGQRRYVQQVIDPCDGDIYKMAVQQHENPATGALWSENAAHTNTGQQATLVTASDGTQFFQDPYAAVRKLPNYPGVSLTSQRMGLLVRDYDGSGVLVLFVVPFGAASRATGGQGAVPLAFADVITAINGQRVGSTTAFSNAVRSSPVNASLTFRSLGGNTETTLTTSLNNMNPGIQNNTAQRTRFGAYVQNNGGRGVTVTGVMPNTPAMRMSDGVQNNWHLDPGDVITHVNGAAVRDETDYRSKVAESPQEMNLTVIGPNGKVYYFTATLND